MSARQTGEPMKRQLIFIFVVSVVLGSAAQADGQAVPTVITSSVNWAATRSSRRAQATEWLAEMSAMAKQIPTLSPAEAAWIKVEYDDQLAGNHDFFTPRAVRARHSKEGSARFAKPVADEIVSVLSQLASGAALQQQKEVALWSSLAYLALDVNFWGDVARLGELGVIARDKESKLDSPGFSTYQEALHSMWASRSQSILGAIVVPFLNKAG